ncbi:NBS type disease resistance protein, putative [Medicago truncatula]|uniref:NBS type disease resistance protein, putative n=1 Tax=Medicago truncatula TaxID=3880 RepID=A0A072TXX1_MEDTR|nr:NBS type disease resistance protein, putative [Medicago truncatula]
MSGLIKAYLIRTFLQWQNFYMRMKCFLREADRKQDEGGETIKNLISEIRKLAYDVEDLIENYAIELELTSALNPVYKLWHIHKVGKRIIVINSQIANLTKRLQAYGLTATRGNEELHFSFFFGR